MAETVHLELIGAAAGTIPGESTQISMGRENTIECVYFEQGVTLAGTGLTFGPFIFRKRIDRASPFLVKFLAEKEKIHGSFRFFRPSPLGDGTTQQFYTIAFDQACITKVREYLPDTIQLATASEPPLEEVWITAQFISWNYEGMQVAYKGVTTTPSPV